MILIGQYISPFVRRVGIALTLYRLPFEHRPWSTFGDADLIRPYNPTLRVPALVLDDGSTLIDSLLILKHLDGLVAPKEAMCAPAGAAGCVSSQLIALATAVADKAVSLVYEIRLHPEPSKLWVERCTAQINGGLSAIESHLQVHATDRWVGSRLGHVDIAIATAFRFVSDSHPLLVAWDRFPLLARHCARLEATPAFIAIQHAHMVPHLHSPASS